jgi:hypothetical protein
MEKISYKVAKLAKKANVVRFKTGLEDFIGVLCDFA